MLETPRPSPFDSPAQTAVLGRLGPYVLLRETGRGAAATVYEAYDERMDRHVAVKVLERSHTVVTDDATDSDPLVDASPSSSSGDSSERDVARFRREARTIASVSHPNIVQVFDIGEASGRHYLVMELLPGQTLRERLDKGPVAFAEALPILTQIAAALDALHARGIIHRDLKPSNVMLLPDGRVKVLDFGVARRAKSEEITLTIAGSLVGSPAYMSPEQVQGATATHASDIWALGVLAYELLQGSSPFGGNNIAAVLYRVTHEPPMALSQFGQGVNAVVGQALNKKPEERFTTATDFVQALRVAGESTRTTTPSRLTPPTPTLSVPASVPARTESVNNSESVHSHTMRVVPARGVSPLTIATSVAVVAVAGVGYLLWNRSHPSALPQQTGAGLAQQTAPNTQATTEVQGSASSNLAGAPTANKAVLPSARPSHPNRAETIKKTITPVPVVSLNAPATPQSAIVKPKGKALSVSTVGISPVPATSRLVIKPSSKPSRMVSPTVPVRERVSIPVSANVVTMPPPVFRPLPSASPTLPKTAEQPKRVKPKKSATTNTTKENPLVSTVAKPTATPEPASKPVAVPTPEPERGSKQAQVATPAPSPTESATNTSGLTGRWQGNIGKNSATLQITNQDNETFSGFISLQTASGTVRVPVTGTFNAQTGRVVFEASGDTNGAQVGTQKGRLIGQQSMGGMATLQVEENGVVKARIFPWSFTR